MASLRDQLKEGVAKILLLSPLIFVNPTVAGSMSNSDGAMIGGHYVERIKYENILGEGHCMTSLRVKALGEVFLDEGCNLYLDSYNLRGREILPEEEPARFEKAELRFSNYLNQLNKLNKPCN